MFTGFKFEICKYYKISTLSCCTIMLLLKIHCSVQCSNVLNNCINKLGENRQDLGVFSATSKERH